MGKEGRKNWEGAGFRHIQMAEPHLSVRRGEDVDAGKPILTCPLKPTSAN